MSRSPALTRRRSIQEALTVWALHLLTSGSVAAGCAPDDNIGSEDSGASAVTADAAPDARFATDGGAAQHDASHAADASVEGASADPPASGVVEILPVYDPPGMIALTASFARSSGDAGDVDAGPCHTRVIGSNCTATTCTEPTSAPAGSETLVSAGTLTVGAATFSPIPAGSDAGTPGGYSGTSGVAWPSGQTVHVRATGGVVPAFEGDVVAVPLLTVSTPPGIVGTANGLNAELTGGLSKSGVPLAWTPVDGIQVFATVVQTKAGEYEAEVTVNCTFDAAAGSGTIPAAALTDLSTAPALQDGVMGPDTVLTLSTVSETSVMAGNDPIYISAVCPSAQFNLPLNMGVSP